MAFSNSQRLRRTQSIIERLSDQLASSRRASSDANIGARNRFVEDYRAVCAEVHGSIKPPDFDTNQRIPIEDLYVPARLATAKAPHEPNDISPESLKDRIDRTVILGDPGGGKSTLANYLTLLWARDRSGPLPFHVTLRDYAKDSGERSIVEFIEGQLSVKYQLSVVADVIGDCISSGNAVVIFDGLDELTDPTKRRAITSAVEVFAFRYPMARVLVTSRRVGYEQARLDPTIFESYVLDGFNSFDVEVYVHKWFASQHDYSQVEAKDLSAQFMLQSRAVEDLSSNPLMLSLMCIIFRGENFIPRNRPAIYEKCANLLFEKWDGHRQIEVPLLARDYVDAAMKHLAYLFLSREAGESGITRSELVKEMVSYLYPRAMETENIARQAADEFVSFCAGRAWVFSDAGTTADGEDIFTFTHRTFMEYFAAVHLLRISDTPERLAKTLMPRISREEWDVVAQLAIQQADRAHDRGTERALQTMLRDTRRKSKASRVRVLGFVVRCSEFAVVSPSFLRELSNGCLAYFLRAFRADDRGPHDTLRTLLSLQEHIPEAQTPVVVDAHRQALEEQLAAAPSNERDNALTYLLLGLVRRFNGRVWREDRRSGYWSEMFRDVAVASSSILREEAGEDSYIWQALLVGGVVDPDEVLSELRSLGLSFAEIYLYTSVVRGFDLTGTTLASMMISALINPDHKGLDNDIIESVMRAFLDDFWSATRSRDTVAPNLGRHYFGDSVVERLSRQTDLSAVAVEFLLIASLSLSEVARVSGDPGQRLTTAEVDIVKELGLSDRARDFALRWIEGEVTVFDVIETGQDDGVMLEGESEL